MKGFGIFKFPAPPRDRWVVGWLTGLDSDLVCVKPDVLNSFEGDLALSPVCYSPLMAALGFLLKRILLAIDINLVVDAPN